jgi:hypothetical protein
LAYHRVRRKQAELAELEQAAAVAEAAAISAEGEEQVA